MRGGLGARRFDDSGDSMAGTCPETRRAHVEPPQIVCLAGTMGEPGTTALARPDMVGVTGHKSHIQAGAGCA